MLLGVQCFTDSDVWTAANIFKKQLRSADNGWSPRL